MTRFAFAIGALAIAAVSASAMIGPPVNLPDSLSTGLPDAAATDAARALSQLAGAESMAGGLNPISVLGGAAEAFGSRGGSDGTGGEGGGLSAAVNIMVLLTVLTLAPAILLMTTCFVRIIIVLGLLKQAIGAQNMPPSQVISGLAIFMTLMVMSPTIDRVWDEAIEPYRAGEITDYDTLWTRAKQPLRDFMFDQIEASGNWSGVYMILDYRGVDTSEPQNLTRSDVDMITLVPAYMLSELRVAFTMGFKLYLPFLVIDMVIASILISMSMMMLPPVLISLPFKLLLFILVDGWTLVAGSLMRSFVQSGGVEGVTASVAVVAG